MPALTKERHRRGEFPRAWRRSMEPLASDDARREFGSSPPATGRTWTGYGHGHASGLPRSLELTVWRGVCLSLDVYEGVVVFVDGPAVSQRAPPRMRRARIGKAVRRFSGARGAR